MNRKRNPVRRFLTAEEVPRWFGLSLVLIYLVGLGTVARLGIALAGRDAAAYYQRSSEYAVRLLAERLGNIEGEGPSDAKWRRACQRALGEFVATIPAHTIRIVQDRRIVASTSSLEMGMAVEDELAGTLSPGEVEVVGQRDEDRDSVHRLLRSPITGPWSTSSTSIHSDAAPDEVDGQSPPYLPLTGAVAVDAPDGGKRADPDLPMVAPDAGASNALAQTGDDSGSGSEVEQEGAVVPTVVYVEAVLPLDASDGSSLAAQAGTLSIVLVVLGALFVVYRCLREQLRGVWRIADRLELHRERIEEDLASLRIVDTPDAVTVGWNELVDLTQRLMSTVQKTEANEELSIALKRSSGGAVADALNAIPDGIIYIADEVRFEFLNASACRLLEWNAEEAKRTALPEAKSSGIGDRILEVLRGAVQPDGSFEARTEVLESDGPESHDPGSYRVLVVPLQHASHAGECVVVIRDVSQQLRAERAREEFVAQVTHELRTPLTNIRAYAETLSSGMFDDPNVITECYNVITKETRRLSRLIEDVLSVSQLEVGTIELRVDNVDLKTLLTEGLRDVRGLADDKEIDVQLVLPSKLETVQGDRDKLAVVINNLLGNAIKYTPLGGNVLVGCQATSDAITLTFKDNGIGISPEDQTRVFEKFQRGSNPEVQEETGTGIGLYTAREIVRRHGGDIELISEKNEGSTFMVRLPHCEGRSAAMSATAPGENSGIDTNS